MRCLSCQYDLSNLSAGAGGEHRCPECGRAFDPNDSTTFDTGRGRLPPWVGRLCIIIALSAFLLPALWYSTWLAAVISLGYPPRCYVNDPKFINGWVSCLHNLTLMMFLLSLPLFAVNLMLAAMTGIQRCASERRWTWSALIPIGVTLVTWITAVWLMRLGGREMGCWFWD